MKVFTGYKPVYCGKCKEGFLSKIENGEYTIVPCECKIRQDKEYLYQQYKIESGITTYKLGTYSFDNKDQWINKILDDKDLGRTGYTNLYKNNLESTSTKLISLIDLFKWIGSFDPDISTTNFFISNYKDSTSENPGYNFVQNFIAHSLIKRLIKTRYLTYTELKNLLLDKKMDINSIIKDYQVILITQLFSDEMIKDMDLIFVFEKIQRFFNYLYQESGIRIIASSSRYGGLLRENGLVKLPVSMNLPNSRYRCNILLDIILNNSYTSVFNVAVNDKGVFK